MLQVVVFGLLVALAGCASTVTGPAPGPTDASVDGSVITDASSDGGDVVPIDVGVPLDATSSVSDDCARGTWCWERPLPTGETAIEARVFSPRAVVYATAGGTVARFDGTTWRTRVFAVPAPVNAMWAASVETLYLLCSSDGSPGEGSRQWLVRVEGDRASIVDGPRTGSGSTLVGTAEDDLWWLSERSLMHWDGRAVTSAPAPGGAVLAGLVSDARGAVTVLESWGSGSGFGVLHRYTNGAWSRLVELRATGLRGEAPLVKVGDTIWLRGWDSDAGVSELIAVDGDAARVEAAPYTDYSLTLHAAGDALWGTSGTRAAVFEDGRWVRFNNVPIGFRSVIRGVGAQPAWVFGTRVGVREGSTFRLLGDGALSSVAGFLDDNGASPALVTSQPASIVAQTDARATWSTANLGIAEGLQAFARASATTTWLGTELGAHAVVSRRATERVSWPAGAGSVQRMAAWEGSLWALTQRGVERYRDGRWLDAVAVPPPEGVRAPPTVVAMHAVDADTALLATQTITGDKTVHLEVLAMRDAAFTRVYAGRGEFGRSVDVQFAGALPDVWFSLEGLRHWNGARVATLPASADVIVDHALADGRAVVHDARAVQVWAATANTPSREVPMPGLRGSTFSYAQARPDGVMRVASGAGWVLRYTP